LPITPNKVLPNSDNAAPSDGGLVGLTFEQEDGAVIFTPAAATGECEALLGGHRDAGMPDDQNAHAHEDVERDSLATEGGRQPSYDEVASDDEQLAYLIAKTREADGFGGPVDVPFLIQNPSASVNEAPKRKVAARHSSSTNENDNPTNSSDGRNSTTGSSSRATSNKPSPEPSPSSMSTFHPWWFVVILTVSACSTGYFTALSLAWRQMGSVPGGLIYTGLFLLNLESVRTFVDLVIATAHGSSHFKEAAGWNCGM